MANGAIYAIINNMKKFEIYFLLFIFFSAMSLALPALAHQPRIVSSEEITEIKKPDVSQAFYGNLTGKPHFFKINSGKYQEIYFGILVPDLINIDKDVSLKIYFNDEIVGSLNGQNYEWKSFYEEFGGDYYYQGPEKKFSLNEGLYTIKVFSPDNQGKYVLVVGQEEKFPVTEIINTIMVLPKIKKDFFEKPIYTAFFNRIGLFTFGPLIILVLIIVLVLIPFLILRR